MKISERILLCSDHSKEVFVIGVFGEIKTSSLDRGNLWLIASWMFQKHFENLSFHNGASEALSRSSGLAQLTSRVLKQH
jgi:hypothetical protein